MSEVITLYSVAQFYADQAGLQRKEIADLKTALEEARTSRNMEVYYQGVSEGQHIISSLMAENTELKESIKKHRRDIEANHPNIKYWKEDYELWGDKPRS